MHLFIGLLRTWRTTLSENQRRLSGSHALLERLCSQFQRCTLVRLLITLVDFAIFGAFIYYCEKR